MVRHMIAMYVYLEPLCINFQPVKKLVRKHCQMATSHYRYTYKSNKICCQLATYYVATCA